MKNYLSQILQRLTKKKTDEVETRIEYVERIVEVPGPERVVEVVKEVIKEVEVPGPERVVEVEKVVEDTTRVSQLLDDNKSLKKRIKELEEIASKQPEVIEKIVEVEKTVEVPVEVEKAATGDLREAARLLAHSEFNKEDLPTD